MAVKINRQPLIKVVDAVNVRNVRRRPRRPVHAFNIKTRPWEITPFLIAPVLPGETMESLLMQSRVVSDPIQNPLIGWWKEYYFFYVCHRALRAQWDTNGLLQDMMLNTSTDVSSLKAAANSAPWYTYKTGMDWVLACTKTVVGEFFRDEGEALNDGLWDDYYLAQINQEGWWHSLSLDNSTAGSDDAELPYVDELEENSGEVLSGFTGPYAQWEILRDNGLTDATYEDYLRSYGVDVPKEEETASDDSQKYKPELLRFVRSWTYPTNHVDPSTGTPSSALSWSIAERADKKRFFKEPGFIFGVTVTRPKIYLGSQKGAAVGLLDGALSWLPAVLSDHPYTSVVKKTNSTTDGILQTTYTDYWVDIKDLFVHGDQFLNVAASAAVNHGLAMPISTDLATDTLNKRYPTEAMMNSIFSTTDGTKSYIREDGVCHLNVLSRVVDTTPGG